MAEPYVIDHPLFGTVEIGAPDEYGELIDLESIKVSAAEIPTTLFYSSVSMAKLTQQSLDSFAVLAKRIEDFDAIVRKNLPDSMIEEWLADRADISVWRTELQELARQNLADVFPNAGSLTDVSREDFIAALKLARIQFSLDQSQSGGAALTMDYRILPIEIDGGVFAANFNETGVFIDVVTES
jgi:hypothetical protein